MAHLCSPIWGVDGGAGSHNIAGHLLEHKVVGTMAGMSSLAGPLLITDMMALRLPRDVFVGSISVAYLFGALPMYAGMMWWRR